MEAGIMWDFLNVLKLKFSFISSNTCTAISDLPAEVKKRFDGAWHLVILPGEEVELSDCPRFVSLQILQVEAPHQVIITPDVLRDQVYLENTSVIK